MADPIPFILDCDPGHDDALAMILGLARPELELLAVTTVAGNAGLAATTDNALRVLTLVGRTDIPVAAGAARTADAAAARREQRPWRERPRGRRPAGADGRAPGRRAAIELLRATLERRRAPVTIAAVGPLTNIALLLRTHPQLARADRQHPDHGRRDHRGEHDGVRRVQHLAGPGGGPDRASTAAGRSR